MVHKGKKKAVASSPSSSTICDKAASKKIPSASDYKHDKVLKEQEKFPSLADMENEGEEGKKKGQDSMEEEVNVGAGVLEGTAKGIQKLPEGFYEVEAIRDKQYHKGQPQYLIKWRDYPETNNTWEPYENIKYCTDMLETFEQSSQKHNRKRGNALPKKKCSMQTKDGSDGTTACKFSEERSPLYMVEEGEGEVKGKHKLVEDFYEDKAIPKKLYHNDEPQYLIKRHDYLVNNSTSGSYDNNIYCADLLETLNQSSWKCKRKRNNALSKEKHSAQAKDGRDDTNQKRGDDSSPLIPSSNKGRERGTGSGTTCSVKKDIIVYKRKQTCTAEKDIIVYQRRHRLSIDSLDKKGKYIMKDQTEKEKATEEEPAANKVPGPLPDVKKRVQGMTNEGGKNFIMQDYVQKQREKEEAKSGVGSTYFSIFFPNYKENTEENGEAPPLPPFVRTMPDFYSPPQLQASKARSRLTGTKRRKSGHVRRFIHSDEEAKKAINAEVVDSTEAIATPVAVDTATSNNSEKATEKVQGSKVAFRSKPISDLSHK